MAALGRGFGQLGGDAGLDDRTVPPWADGEQRIVEHEGLAVRRHALLLRPRQPFGDLLAGLVLGVEVVIAGADHELVLARETVEIFPHHDALRAPIDQRGEVEMVARHHHHVEVGSNIEDPVELRQRIMQVGYQEESHGAAFDGAYRAFGGRNGRQWQDRRKRSDYTAPSAWRNTVALSRHHVPRRLPKQDVASCAVVNVTSPAPRIWLGSPVPVNANGSAPSFPPKKNWPMQRGTPWDQLKLPFWAQAICNFRRHNVLKQKAILRMR